MIKLQNDMYTMNWFRVREWGLDDGDAPKYNHYITMNGKVIKSITEEEFGNSGVMLKAWDEYFGKTPLGRRRSSMIMDAGAIAPADKGLEFKFVDTSKEASRDYDFINERRKRISQETKDKVKKMMDELEVTRVKFRLEIHIDWDWKFFAILPAININIHSKSLEFEWLWLGIYIDKK